MPRENAKPQAQGHAHSQAPQIQVWEPLSHCDKMTMLYLKSNKKPRQDFKKQGDTDMDTDPGCSRVMDPDMAPGSSSSPVYIMVIGDSAGPPRGSSKLRQ
ncbi:hypothetical protein STEG23_008462 [Scotinomys teguina]